MKITKQSLYDFVEKKVSGKQEELTNEIDSYMKLNIKSHLENELSGINHFAKKLTKLADELETTMENVNDYESWSRKSRVRDLRYVSKIKNDIIGEETHKFKQAILNNSNYSKYNADKLIDKAKKDLKEVVSKKENLFTLKRELDATIKSSTTGKQAYDALIKLGIDMEDFEGAESQLPAIQKLSVDPCLVNGNCN
ncbi:hypothetical protein M3E13_11615 [Oceanobacillus kimchii]|uniref:hypothetical protein n=1 Tax=Oceanobacillus kimchii TaxID=746691 RepID=UPI0021A2C142|nr:hypothetical protein [Oceanobacillus kimchii]MCT1577565.1 hypothetical protein [Oceanobacillus kimchii]MCT2136553.1 hypothetical protein [Oceanobacillus kimchii]